MSSLPGTVTINAYDHGLLDSLVPGRCPLPRLPGNLTIRTHVLPSWLITSDGALSPMPSLRDSLVPSRRPHALSMQPSR